MWYWTDFLCREHYYLLILAKVMSIYAKQRGGLRLSGYWSCVSVSVLLYRCTLRNADETHREKAIWTLHKNSECCNEILEAALNKTTAARPPTSYLINYPSKTSKTYQVLLEKQGRSHKWRFLADSGTWSCRCWSASKEKYQLYVDTGFSLEDLLRAMDDRDW